MCVWCFMCGVWCMWGVGVCLHTLQSCRLPLVSLKMAGLIQDTVRAGCQRGGPSVHEVQVLLIHGDRCKGEGDMEGIDARVRGIWRG